MGGSRSSSARQAARTLSATFSGVLLPSLNARTKSAAVSKRNEDSAALKAGKACKRSASNGPADKSGSSTRGKGGVSGCTASAWAKRIALTPVWANRLPANRDPVAPFSTNAQSIFRLAPEATGALMGFKS